MAPRKGAAGASAATIGAAGGAVAGGHAGGGGDAAGGVGEIDGDSGYGCHCRRVWAPAAGEPLPNAVQVPHRHGARWRAADNDRCGAPRARGRRGALARAPGRARRRRRGGRRRRQGGRGHAAGPGCRVRARRPRARSIRVSCACAAAAVWESEWGAGFACGAGGEIWGASLPRKRGRPRRRCATRGFVPVFPPCACDLRVLGRAGAAARRRGARERGQGARGRARIAECTPQRDARRPQARLDVLTAALEEKRRDRGVDLGLGKEAEGACAAAHAHTALSRPPPPPQASWWLTRRSSA